MADDIVLSTNVGTGDTLKADELSGGEKVPYSKILDGTADSSTEIQAGAGTAANALRVELPTDGTGVVGLNAGTNSIGKVGLDAGTNEIGKTKTEGKVAHDASGTSIAPLLQGAIAYAADGTAPGTDVAEGDLTRLKSTLDGRLLVTTAHPFAWNANNNSSSAETNTELVAAPGAGLSLHICQVVISSLTAQTTKFVEDGGGTPVDIVPIIYTGANGSHYMMFDPPLRITANKNFAYTTTAGVATSVMVTGFTSA